jgi:thiol:disulfide interchange protein DsbD
MKPVKISQKGDSETMMWFYFVLLLIAVESSCYGGFNDIGGKTRVTLSFPTESAQPGQTLLAGIRFELRDGWHTYWRYPGESGAAASLQWKLPPGIVAGDVLWPVPEKLTEEGLTTYVYDKEVVLLVPLTISKDVAKGAATIQVAAGWIECKTSCVSSKAEISSPLAISDQPARPSTNGAWLSQWQKRLPQAEAPFPIRSVLKGDANKLNLEITLTNLAEQVDFFPFENELCEISHNTERITNADATITLKKSVVCKDNRIPKAIDGLLVAKSGSASQGYEVHLNLEAKAPVQAVQARSLWGNLLFAFLGGLILNVMPCVLPVIALKILGFVNQNKAHPARTRMLGLVYGLGVLVSFGVLAAMVILVKQAGHRAGWGMQFGNPQFLVVLTVLVTLVALNLFGLFEVSLSGGVMGTAGGLASKEGGLGAFFNGVLATVLATPCTAPFLGAALGFAFLQPAHVILLVFLTAGLGLAAPYVLLSWNPGWLKFLPKPGAWMEKLKIGFGFPMLATAMWLFLLTSSHYGKQIVWFGLFLIVLAMGTWLFGEFFQKGRKHRGLAIASALLLVACGYGYAMESQLHWRHAVKEGSQEDGLPADGIPWQRWNADAVAKARSEGRPVFVDFTADWCLTCQVNKKTSIDIDAVREKLKSVNAVALLGDYTRLPDAITQELNRFERAGVPLVLVYPKDASKPPLVLPELLTPQTVLNALDEASR